MSKRRGMLNTPVAEIPAWAIDSDRKDAAAFVAAMALANLEGKWVRLPSATQRRILGYPVFGKAPILVENGEIRVHRSPVGGAYEEYYSPADINRAVAHGKRLNQP